MTLQPFTDNFTDNSSEAGFQFTFNCALCGEGYQTKFISSKSYKKGKTAKTIGGIFGAAAQMLGKYNVGYGVEKATDVLGGKFGEMSPEWRKEHD
ncbi:MAG: zinc ribbon domain-containing protein, partial [Candidatus Pacebacteria bacterium]|nr:zinc ribbon domain-containing protein [Candidatus Paceibacterota bacterium]